MKHEITRRKMVLLLVLGMGGCLLMGGSDWLMIYGDTAYGGSLAWLTVGVGQIPAWRNSLALFLAFPAVILYSFGLFAVQHFLMGERQKKTYCTLTALGLTPWLCLHLFYVMILYLFSYLTGRGYGPEGALLGEALVSHFGWLIPVCDVVMLMPYLYLLVLTLKRKTIFSRWMALNNPLFLFLILKGLTMVMPDRPFRLAFTNGLMSEAMLLWFGIYLIGLGRKK